MTVQMERAEQEKPNIKSTIRPKVIVIGAGFGGLHVAEALARKDVDVLVLDKNNYHGFWPLLYQVATSGLEPDSIAYPVRAILRKFPNVDFQLAEVQQIDFEKKQVITNMTDPLYYDYLVVAAGSTNNFFGNDQLATNTMGLKDLNEAIALRNRVLLAFEQAVGEKDPARQKALMTFVIIGGGPTGVELAGAFSELIAHVLRKDYPMLDTSMARVVLVEASPSLLATFPESLRKSAEKRLKKMGVEINLRVAVESVNNDLVTLKDGRQIPAHNVIWAAGIRGALLADKLDVKLGRGARIPVEPTLNLSDHPEVYVVGDLAYLEGYKNKLPYPQVAQVAMQQGKRAAKNILAQIKGQPLQPFHYADKGSMATIGRAAAVMDAFGIRLSGFLAWVGWLFIHLLYLVGFRNRLVALTNWTYNYFTYDRGARLVIGQNQK